VSRRILAVVACLLWLVAAGPSFAEVPAQPIAQAELLVDAARSPPPLSAPWRAVQLPDRWRKSRPGVPPSAAWYRVRFDVPADAPPAWGVFLPWMYDGGDVWLNGALVAQVPQNTSEWHVRWIRPHAVDFPPALLRAGTNELMVRAAHPPPGASARFPRPTIAPMSVLQPLYERRFFWQDVTPQITTTVCLLASLCVLFIWWRRPGEVIYGLFGAAAALWGVRTLIFTMELIPAGSWFWWRLLFHACTGGFIVAMTALAWRLAGIHKPWFERALFAYWLIGPLWLLAQGAAGEPMVNRWWIGGFLPIGATVVGVSAWFLVRRRTLEAAALPVTLAITALAGMHDYLIAWDLDPDVPWLAAWTAERFQLMNLGATLVLVAMGCLLTGRFVRALRSLEDLNQGLEQRVAERERELAANYARVFALEREQAAAQERQRIMRDIHDGLGSRLFVSLSRVERGDMPPPEIAEALRGCISEMRLALDTLVPQERDFGVSLGAFLFRWRRQMEACGIRLTWDIDVPGQELQLQPHASLQLLRVAEEALTNVVKHAGASAVDVRLSLARGELELVVRDDGIGAAGVCEDSSGRGLSNMRTRAGQLGGGFEIFGGSGGTRVTVHVPLAEVCA
jgi:signal transduction histidine kinase